MTKRNSGKSQDSNLKDQPRLWYSNKKASSIYYDMKLVTFGIDKDKNPWVQFPVFIQPYTQQMLILYQLETLPVPIMDQNKHEDSYTHLQIETLHGFKFWNLHNYLTTRTKDMQKNRLWILLWSTFHGKTQI